MEGRTPQVNQRVELSIEGVGAGGEGIGRLEGRAVFVPRTLPEEKVLAKIVHVGSRKISAEPQEILEPSPDRRDPVCPVFGRCGGCQLMHAGYAAQLELKSTILRDALLSIAGIRVESIPVSGAQEPLHYRNRGQYPVARQKGRVVTGFFAPRSHDVVAASECHIHDPRVDRAVACVRSWAGRKKIPVYDERRHRGFLRHVVVRAGGEVLVVLVGRQDRNLPAGDLLRRLRREIPGLAGVVLNLNPARTNVILGGRNRVLWGRDHLEELFMSLKLKLSVGSFFQVNTAQAQVLFGKVREFLGRPQGPVVDAYCGVGVLATLLSKEGHETVGIDSAAPAIEDAETIAAQNRVPNAEFHRGRSEKLLPRLINSGLRPQAVILDPPRKGCAPEVIDAVAASKADRIAYISCHPGTLSRDLKRFVELGYRLDTIEGVDMFPQTSHLEVLAGLVRT